MTASAGSSKTVYIALGANLGEPIRTFSNVLADLAEWIGAVQRVSRIYNTAPLNAPENAGLEQPDFLNAVVACGTPLTPEQVLSRLLQIEQIYGRQRIEGARWLPRTIDLDIIAYEGASISTPDLEIPHREMHRRDFVLVPMADVAPGYVHPRLGRTVTELLRELRADPSAELTNPRAVEPGVCGG